MKKAFIAALLFGIVASVSTGFIVKQQTETFTNSCDDIYAVIDKGWPFKIKTELEIIYKSNVICSGDDFGLNWPDEQSKGISYLYNSLFFAALGFVPLYVLISRKK